MKYKQRRLKGHDYSEKGVYFITVNTKDRRNYFWSKQTAETIKEGNVVLNRYGALLRRSIEKIPAIYDEAELLNYAIMPDHLHILLSIGTGGPDLSRAVRGMKGYVSKKIGQSIWQDSYYDRIVRNEKELEEINRYIDENPLQTIDEGHKYGFKVR